MSEMLNMEGIYRQKRQRWLREEAPKTSFRGVIVEVYRMPLVDGSPLPWTLWALEALLFLTRMLVNGQILLPP